MNVTFCAEAYLNTEAILSYADYFNTDDKCNKLAKSVEIGLSYIVWKAELLVRAVIAVSVIKPLIAAKGYMDLCETFTFWNITFESLEKLVDGTAHEYILEQMHKRIPRIYEEIQSFAQEKQTKDKREKILRDFLDEDSRVASFARCIMPERAKAMVERIKGNDKLKTIDHSKHMHLKPFGATNGTYVTSC